MSDCLLPWWSELCSRNVGIHDVSRHGDVSRFANFLISLKKIPMEASKAL